MTVSYVHGLDLICQNRSGYVSYYHYDGQHSTRQLSDEAAQTIDTYTYDAFGLLLQRAGSTENNYLYTGEQFDPNVGFYYLRARYYNPEIGRFTTIDPWKGSIYDPISLHKYIYCNNDPVDFVDWSGENGFAGSCSLVEMVTVMTIAVILAGIATTLLNEQLDLFPYGWDPPMSWEDLKPGTVEPWTPSDWDGGDGPDFGKKPDKWYKKIVWYVRKCLYYFQGALRALSGDNPPPPGSY